MDRDRRTGLMVVRYGLGGALVITGVVLLAVNPGGFGVDGFALAVGAGLSVLLINFLFRLGVSGDRERDREEQAREYFDDHGVWPDEDERPHERKWHLPAGAVTAEQEEQEREGR
jgi:hypothetical protein